MNSGTQGAIEHENEVVIASAWPRRIIRLIATACCACLAIGGRDGGRANQAEAGRHLLALAKLGCGHDSLELSLSNDRLKAKHLRHRKESDLMLDQNNDHVPAYRNQSVSFFPTFAPFSPGSSCSGYFLICSIAHLVCLSSTGGHLPWPSIDGKPAKSYNH